MCLQNMKKDLIPDVFFFTSLLSFKADLNDSIETLCMSFIVSNFKLKFQSIEVQFIAIKSKLHS